MSKIVAVLKRRFWPISAVLFGPWHAPLLLAAVSRLLHGTVLGEYISAHYGVIKGSLVLLFSLYFTLAFMVWMVGKRRLTRGGASAPGDQQQVIGLSTPQIVAWGLVGMVLLPAVMVLSALADKARFIETFSQFFRRDVSMNAGFIWLLSISTVIMIPTMIIWLVWMWRAWSKSDGSQTEQESWGYEYD